MAKACGKCGKALSFFQTLGSGLCPECDAEADRQRVAAARGAAAEQERLEREAADRRYEAAVKGEASSADLKRLDSDGYLIAGGRLVRCPICGHDRFHQQRLLMNTRAATFFNLDWANSGADARICQNCTHVLWFARG
ncbi:MAG: hypothetical protein U0835_17925 [Isosphaeraceae bacterium]